MTVKDLQYISIDAGLDWVTNADLADLPENYIYDGRGVRLSRRGFLFERDFGTQHRFASYPSKPSAITIVNGFTIFDPDAATEYEIVVGYDTSNYFHVYVNDSSLSATNPGSANDWIELTRVFTAHVNGTPADTSTSVNIDNILDSLQAAYSLASDELKEYIAWNVDRNNFARITSSGATSVTAADVYLSSSGLAWVDNDNIIFFQNFGWMDSLFTTAPTNPPTAASINNSQGTSPHIRWTSIEARNKVNMFWGNSASPVVAKEPLRIERRAARSYFWTAAAGAKITLQSNWYLEKGGGGLCPFYGEKGTLDAPITTFPTADTASIEDKDGNVFMKISYNMALASAAAGDAARVVMTILYDGYQESDPVYKWYFGTCGVDPYLSITSVQVNFARMNKNIVGIKFYGAYATATTAAAGWADADSDYHESVTIWFDRDEWVNTYLETRGYDTDFQWGVVATSEWNYQTTTTATSATVAPQVFPRDASLNSLTLASNLGHATDTTRSYLTPRYAARLARAQGAFSVVDADDLTLRLSSFDGSGVNNDDNFPDRATDNNGQTLTITLNGHGILRGITTMNGIVYAFRDTEFETYDVFSGVQDIVQCDFASPRSLISTPYGLFWAGNAALYWLPLGGGIPVPITDPIQNFYDGTLMIDNGTGTTPYITRAYRNAIIAGYDPTYQEVWFHTQATEDTEYGGSTEYLNLRYVPSTRKFAPPRELNISAAVKYFTQRYSDTNGSYFTIGYASGLLRYPVIAGASTLYKDGVTSADSGGNAIPTRVAINMGSLYGIAQSFAIYDIVLNQVAGNPGSETFNIDLYANDETTAFYQLNHKLSESSIVRGLPPRGQLDRIRLKFSLGGSSTATRWVMSKASLGVTRQRRIGNV